LAAFQIVQEKLVHMLGNIQAMLLVGWRLCKLYESGKMTPGHASLGKVKYLNTMRLFWFRNCYSFFTTQLDNSSGMDILESKGDCFSWPRIDGWKWNLVRLPSGKGSSSYLLTSLAFVQ